MFTYFTYFSIVFTALFLIFIFAVFVHTLIETIVEHIRKSRYQEIRKDIYGYLASVKDYIPFPVARKALELIMDSILHGIKHDPSHIRSELNNFFKEQRGQKQYISEEILQVKGIRKPLAQFAIWQ